ncbi:hypothetical protein NC653_004402 [Populus alba x Populus x berolinensis]|uniref:Uncharacterized protein n=1 Tax=Populus alba x Populus x berolinensis TaxID=444605 RepID=A0AAD6RU45_9ROSI|nr:hypothetical protein NC653_004402 [Populus alba x Populus x berolinensis]
MPGSLYATSKDQSFVLDWLLPVACEEPSILSLSLSVCMRAFDHSSAKLLCITSMLLHVLLIFIFPCS